MIVRIIKTPEIEDTPQWMREAWKGITVSVTENKFVALFQKYRNE